jgi:hypothetical protein
MHAGEFAAADEVEAGAALGEQVEDGEVGVGLDRVADQVVERRERGGEAVEVVRDRGGGVDVERRAVFIGELGEGNALGEEFALLDLESGAWSQ